MREEVGSRKRKEEGRSGRTKINRDAIKLDN